jgi:hypothetical protein
MKAKLALLASLAAALTLAAPAGAAPEARCSAFAKDIGYAIIHGWQIRADGLSCARAQTVIVGSGSIAGDQNSWRWQGWQLRRTGGIDWTTTVIATKPGQRIAFRLTIISF